MASPAPEGSADNTQAAIIRRYRAETTRLRAEVSRLRRESRTDAVTGLFSRQAFDEALRTECARVARRTEDGSDDCFALLMIDLDHFKQINDCHGHVAGDAWLKTVARTIRACLRRETDLLARWGGDEFAAILPFTDEPGAMKVARLARDRVAGIQAAHKGTLSIGVAIAHWDGWTPQTITEAADAALYQAKRFRNHVCSSLSPKSLDEHWSSDRRILATQLQRLQHIAGPLGLVAEKAGCHSSVLRAMTEGQRVPARQRRETLFLLDKFLSHHTTAPYR